MSIAKSPLNGSMPPHAPAFGCRTGDVNQRGAYLQRTEARCHQQRSTKLRKRDTPVDITANPGGESPFPASYENAKGRSTAAALRTSQLCPSHEGCTAPARAPAETTSRIQPAR
jgi:hypothetical protein